MYKLLVVTQFKMYTILEKPHIPRISEHIDVFYEPIPIITNILNFPTTTTLDAFKTEYSITEDISDVTTIIFVE